MNAPFKSAYDVYCLKADPTLRIAVAAGARLPVQFKAADWKSMARILKIPYLPISPFLPLLGPFAYFPLPTKFHVEFGAPMRFTGPFDDEDHVIQGKVDDYLKAVHRVGLIRR